MPRIKKANPHKRTAAANGISPTDFMAEPQAEKRRDTVMSKQAFEKLLIETNDLKERKAWSEFTPKHFVGLYCLLHAHVYKVLPDEVRNHYKAAVGKAMLMRKHEFGGSNDRMIDFTRWVWAREAKREDKREADNNFRIGWRLQFASTFLSDYRVALARKGKKIQ